MKFLSLILVSLVAVIALTGCGSNPPQNQTYNQDNYYGSGGQAAYLYGGPRVMPQGDSNNLTLIYNKYATPVSTPQQPYSQGRQQYYQPQQHPYRGQQPSVHHVHHRPDSVQPQQQRGQQSQQQPQVQQRPQPTQTQSAPPSRDRGNSPQPAKRTAS